MIKADIINKIIFFLRSFLAEHSDEVKELLWAILVKIAECAIENISTESS